MKKMVRNEDAFIQKFYENMVRKVDSVYDQYNSLMEEYSTSLASFWVTISLLLTFVLISLILSFFIFIIIYASIVIAFLAINHLCRM